MRFFYSYIPGQPPIGPLFLALLFTFTELVEMAAAHEYSGSSATRLCYSCMSEDFERHWPYLEEVYHKPKNFTDYCYKLPPNINIGLTECSNSLCVTLIEPKIIAGQHIGNNVIRGCYNTVFRHSTNSKNYQYPLLEASCMRFPTHRVLPPHLAARSNNRTVELCWCMGQLCNDHPHVLMNSKNRTIPMQKKSGKVSPFWLWLKDEGRAQFRHLYKVTYDQTNNDHKDKITDMHRSLTPAQIKHYQDRAEAMNTPDQILRRRREGEEWRRTEHHNNAEEIAEIRKQHTEKIREGQRETLEKHGPIQIPRKEDVNDAHVANVASESHLRYLRHSWSKTLRNLISTVSISQRDSILDQRISVIFFREYSYIIKSNGMPYSHPSELAIVTFTLRGGIASEEAMMVNFDVPLYYGDAAENGDVPAWDSIAKDNALSMGIEYKKPLHYEPAGAWEWLKRFFTNEIQPFVWLCDVGEYAKTIAGMHFLCSTTKNYREKNYYEEMRKRIYGFEDFAIALGTVSTGSPEIISHIRETIAIHRRVLPTGYRDVNGGQHLAACEFHSQCGYEEEPRINCAVTHVSVKINALFLVCYKFNIFGFREVFKPQLHDFCSAPLLEPAETFGEHEMLTDAELMRRAPKKFEIIDDDDAEEDVRLQPSAARERLARLRMNDFECGPASSSSGFASGCSQTSKTEEKCYITNYENPRSMQRAVCEKPKTTTPAREVPMFTTDRGFGPRETSEAERYRQEALREMWTAYHYFAQYVDRGLRTSNGSANVGYGF